MKALAATRAMMLALVAGMSAGARPLDALAADRVRERARRLGALNYDSPFGVHAPGMRAFGYKRSGSYTNVNTSQEQTRRLRQRAKLESKRTL